MSLWDSQTIVVSCLNCAITILLIIFLIVFLKTRNKSHGNYMILILNFAYILFCLTDLFMPLVVQYGSLGLVGFCDLAKTGLFNFISVWSTFFAIYTFKILQDISKGFNHRNIMAVGLPLCVLMSCALPFLLYFKALNVSRTYKDNSRNYKLEYDNATVWQKEIYLLLCELFAVILPAIVAWTYFKVYKLPRLQQMKKNNIFQKTWLFTTTIVCLVPNLVCDILNYFCPDKMVMPPFTWLVSLSKIMLFSWGLLTLYGFLFLKPGREDLSGSYNLLDDPAENYQLVKVNVLPQKSIKTTLLKRGSFL